LIKKDNKMEINCNTFNKINNAIQELVYYLGDDDVSTTTIQDIITKLSSQFERSANSERSKEDLSNFILDDDALDLITKEDIIVENFNRDVREIQHAIIGFFGQ